MTNVIQTKRHPRAVALRVSRRRILERLRVLYGDSVADNILPRLMAIVERYRRPPRCAPLSEQDVILIAYPDHIQSPGRSPLATLDRFMTRDLGGLVSGVHVLPFYPSSGDKGFAVSNYGGVDPYNGTWQDLDRLGRHGRLMFDFVLNHCSVQHEWFQGFLAGDPKYNQYFYTEGMVDASRAVRARSTPLFTPFETASGVKRVWTTFGPEQADLNYHCPDVLVDMAEVLARYLAHGAEILRLDAAHFTWKESGTACINLPQAHQLMKLLRDIVDAIDPSVIIISETNQPHSDNITYLGDGHDQAQMVYNFALPTLLMHSIYRGEAETISHWAQGLKLPSDEVCVYNYTACHDCIATRGASEILTPQQWQSMIDQAVKYGAKLVMRSTPDGEVPYEICLTFFDALSAPGTELAIAVDRFMLSQAVALALRGVPAVYLPSLFGARSWHEDDPADVARWQPRDYGGAAYEVDRLRAANMERYQYYQIERQIHDAKTRGGQVFARYAQMLRVRRAEPAFHPQAGQRVLNLHPAVLAVDRLSQDGESRVLALHNFSDRQVAVKLPDGPWQDLLGSAVAEGQLDLAAYQVAWLKFDK